MQAKEHSRGQNTLKLIIVWKSKYAIEFCRLQGVKMCRPKHYGNFWMPTIFLADEL